MMYCMTDTQTQTGYRIPVWTVGDRLRKARDEAGITVTEMAQRLGRDRSSVTRYEAARHVQKLVIDEYERATRVPAEWLKDGILPEDDRRTSVTDIDSVCYSRRYSDNTDSRFCQERKRGFN